MKLYLLSKFKIAALEQTLDGTKIDPELVLDDLVHTIEDFTTICVTTPDRLNDQKIKNPLLRNQYEIEIRKIT